MMAASCLGSRGLRARWLASLAEPYLKMLLFSDNQCV